MVASIGCNKLKNMKTEKVSFRGGRGGESCPLEYANFKALLPLGEKNHKQKKTKTLEATANISIMLQTFN